MNANTSRQHSAEWDQEAQLLSQTARDLPTGRHQFHKERLMAQIHEQVQREERTATTGMTAAAPQKARRFRLPRPAITLPAMAAALSAVVVAGVVTVGGDGSGVRDSGVATGPALTTDVGTASAKGVPQLLDQISLAAAEGDHPTVKPGQYIYIESVLADTFVKTVDDKSSLASHELHRRQIWESPDGVKGWLIDPAVNDSPEGETLTLPDEQGNTPKADLGSPSYDYLTKLTTDPDELLAKIYKETKGQGNTPTSRRSPPSVTCSPRATRRRSSTRRCSRPPPRSRASSSSTTRWTRPAAMEWRWPGWTTPAGSARSGSSTRRPMSTLVLAMSR